MVIRDEKRLNQMVHASTYYLVVLQIINLVIVKCVYMSCLYLYFLSESIWFGYYFMQKIEILPLDFYSCSLGDLAWIAGKESPSLPFHHMLSRQLLRSQDVTCASQGRRNHWYESMGLPVMLRMVRQHTLQPRTITNGQCLFPIFSFIFIFAFINCIILTIK